MRILSEMKFLVGSSIVFLCLSMNSCIIRNSDSIRASREDSLKVANDKYFQAQLMRLQKVREDLTGPSAEGDGSVTKGDRFRTSIVGDSVSNITEAFEKLQSKMERAQKDSTTIYGALMTRFRFFNSQHKYLTATYTDDAHLLRFTSEITFDEKHEEDKDFYFTNGSLVYFRERHTFTGDEQDLMTDDAYFVRDGKVVYAYRDEGSAQSRRDRMNVMSMKRFSLTGNLNAHVSRELEKFRQDYEILLSQRLEPLLYPGESKAQ